MGPPVKIDKIAVVFLTKNRESSVTRNKTLKATKKLENSHNSSHHSRRLNAILKFHLPTTVWIDVSRSFRALLPSADQSECVDQSLSLSLSLSPIAREQGKNSSLFCCCCCSRAISKAPRRLITLFIGLSDWVGDRTAWTT